MGDSAPYATVPPGREDTPEQRPSDVTIVAHDIGDVGGMERQLTDLLQGLVARGHRVRVIARTCRPPADEGVDFRRVRAPARPFLLAYPWFLVVGSLAVRRHRRGIVQATGAIVLNRVDIVAVHYCHQVGPANPSRQSRLFRSHVRVASVLKRYGERLCFRVNRPAAFVCVSDGVADEMREHFPALAARVETIFNGVDTKHFAPGARVEQARALRSSLELAPNQLLAAFVGSEWDRKGLEPAIRALARSPEWTLVVAGDGDRARFGALAERLAVADRVRWLGVVSDIQLVYEMSDAFLLPSSYETFSLVTFEAAACGLPILAAAVSGVRRLLEEGSNGFLITRDPESIAMRLRELVADPDLRARLGAAARESALRFSSARMVSEHERLYRRLETSRRR